ncbi:MAG TPA: type III polyketide synthase [Ktedonobacterales bacterium]
MSNAPRVLALASAFPPHDFAQEILAGHARELILGPGWQGDAERAVHGERITQLFAASHVAHRASVVDLPAYYAQPHGTGERMALYAETARDLGRAALEPALDQLGDDGARARIGDFVVASCTGYAAPGLDVLLSRDLGLPHDARRLVIGHMGCFGALAGLRACLAAQQAEPRSGAMAALLCVELTTLHFAPTLDPEVLTACALFGDAAAALVLGHPDAEVQDDTAEPQLVDTYCAADFAAAEQMTWTITDQGFVMGLSPRVPVVLRRTAPGVVERLLAPHGLRARDIAHWIVHPGGPSILEAVQRGLGLSAEQTALAWDVLRDHGNCSSATVLLVLERLLRSGQARPGEWGVMMAFGPGLTLETCLWRF